jgi:hypothetical protein
MADTAAVIDMIKRIIADDTADLRERIQHLEARGVMSEPVSIDTEPESEDEVQTGPPDDELQKRLDTIKAMHRLDASPVQWTRGSGGQMVEAPEGLWEISCLACNHSTVWREGDKKPPQCKTWLIADGQQVE